MQKIFSYRKSDLLSSRVRFKIQDLIDDYNKEWKTVIYGERQMTDAEGFQYKYVPKEAILTEDQVHNPKNRSRKNSKQSEQNQYVYMKKIKNGGSKESQENGSASKKPIS